MCVCAYICVHAYVCVCACVRARAYVAIAQGLVLEFFFVDTVEFVQLFKPR